MVHDALVHDALVNGALVHGGLAHDALAHDALRSDDRLRGVVSDGRVLDHDIYPFLLFIYVGKDF